MKKLLIIAAIGIASLATAPAAKAQVHLSVNLGIQPDWGPRGYDHVDYYYLPDVDSYYDVPTREYVYLEGGSWVHRRYLPSRYRGYDLYGGRKVVINSRNPWMRHNEYHTRYVTNYRGGGYRGGYNRGGFGGGPRGGYHGNPGRGGFNHGAPGRGGFGGNHGGGNPGGNHGGGFGGNHGGGNPGGNHGGGNPGGNHGGGNPGGGNHGGGGRGGDNHGGGHRG